MSENKTDLIEAALAQMEDAILLIEAEFFDSAQERLASGAATLRAALARAAIPQAVSAEPSEQDAKDAARYRWLRNCGKYAPASLGNGWGLVYGTYRYSPETLDEAVDEAMKKEPQ